MTIKDFNKSVTQQLKRSEELLTKKGQEYAEGAEDNKIDRLAHFKKAAAIIGGTPEQAVLGMLAKHLVSISDMVNSDSTYTTDRWNEKITDSINYLLILKALTEETTANEYESVG